jgi:hypothetical protein
MADNVEWSGEVLKEINRRLGVIEAHPDHCPYRDDIIDHEKRLRTSERLQNILLGGLTVANMVGIWKWLSLASGGWK